MSRAQAITSAATGRIARDAGVAERSVKGFWGAAGGSNFRPYSLIAVSRAFDSASQRSGLLRGSILATTAVFGGFAAALSSNLILRYADSYTKLINQIRVVSSSSADAAARFGAVEEVARRSRSTLEATAVLYSRIQKAAPTRGADEVLRFVETIQKALTLGGATAQEASGAAIQFSQAIASNRLSGDEIRAVLETPLGLELAKGLGVTIGKLREMGVAGKLTADVVLGALSKISESIDTRFAKSIRTVDQAILLVDNRFTSVIGQLSKTYGATILFSNAIVGLGDNLDKIVPSLISVLGLLGAVFLARNKALSGGLGGAAAGAFIGNQVGGLTGALIGGAAGGLLGLRGPSIISNIREESKVAAESVRKLTGQVVDLRKEFLSAGAARSAAIQAQNGDPVLAARSSLQGQFRRVALDPTSSITDINAARAAAAADGQKRLDEAVRKTTADYKFFGGQLRVSNVELGAAARAATVAGQAKAFLGRQVGSLVGLFGGPWGVAITGAVTLLSYLGLKAQENAQKVAAANQIIDEALQRSAGAGDQAAVRTVSDRLLENLQENQKKLQIFADKAKQSIGDTAGLFSLDPAVEKQVTSLVDSLSSGKLTADEFRARLTALGTTPGLENLANIAQAATKDLIAAALAGRALQEQIDSLKKAASSGTIRFQVAFDTTSDKANENLTNTAEVLRSLSGDIKVSAFRAKGLNAEAEAQSIVNREAEQGKIISFDAVLVKTKEKEALDKVAASLKKAGTAAETLASKMAAMKAESLGAFLSDIDREVLKQAKSFKVATSELNAYVTAAKSGDFSKAPPKLVELRDQMLYDQAAESARDIIRQYGNLAQVAPLAADKQRELSIAVKEGAITADQANIAYADFLDQFQATKGIEDFAQAIGDAVGSAITDFSSLTDIVGNFFKVVAKLIVQLTVVEPLVNAIKGGFGNMLGGSGGGGGFLGALFGGFGGGGAAAAPTFGLGSLYHGGGKVGDGSARPKRALPMSTIAMAPRLHSGLGSREFASVLEQGEHVLTRRMTQRTAATINGLSGAAREGGSGVNFNFAPQIDARGADSGVVAKIETTLLGLMTGLKGQMVDVMREVESRRVRI